MTALRILLATLLITLTGAHAHAGPMDTVPDELKPWVGWVLEGHPELRCPVVNGSASCVWPGHLSLDVGSNGARFWMDVQVDRPIAVPLPGGRGTWPTGVRVDGRSAPVLDSRGQPQVRMDPGSHRVEGYWEWASRPARLMVPAAIGRVDLTLDGGPVARPRRAQDGALELGPGEDGGDAERGLELDVSRHIRDGVPVTTTTRVAIRASGPGREVDLGVVLPDGLRAVQLTADLPARFTADSHLIVQVRPGSYTVSIEAIHAGSVASLTAPAQPHPAWPGHEVWAVQLQDRIRAVNLSGPAAVDPARTSLPEEWRGLPTFLVAPAEALHFEELRRGEPTPAPNHLTLHREMWLDASGEGLTVRDRWNGEMHQGWRLEVQPPLELGHASDHGEDLVITRAPETGVELRAAEVALLAESRVPLTAAPLSAVGWQADVHRLSAELYLPPGWQLLGAQGVDEVPGALWDRWSLFDLFFVLILSLAAGRLLGWPWLVVSLIGLTLSRQSDGAPEWTWAVLLCLLALQRALPKGRAQLGVAISRGVIAIGLLIALATFAVDQVHQGLYPTLERPWADATDDANWSSPADKGGWGNGDVDVSIADASVMAPSSSSRITEGRGILGGIGGEYELDRRVSEKKGRSKQDQSGFLSLQMDPTAVVQTGPGVPRWSWTQQTLGWSGPVTPDHQIRLWLLSPRQALVLALLRVLLLTLFGLKLIEARAWMTRLGSHAGSAAAAAFIAMAVGLTAPSTAQAAPDMALLQQLEDRLTTAAACHPDCVTAPALTLFVTDDDQLRVVAEVHVGAAGAWPLPGPAGVWVPDRVRVDGWDSRALARRDDGFVYVRLEPGVHTIDASGPLPPTDAVTIELLSAPKRLQFVGEGWEIGGLRGDGTVDGSVQLTRALAREGGDGADATDDAGTLSPWVEVRRTLDLGIPWRVRTVVQRLGPADAPLALTVPLLRGESVTDDGVQVADGAVLVTLGRDQSSAVWVSTLDEVPELVLTAPVGKPWIEEWRASCSPVFACTVMPGSLDPLQHERDGRWAPTWRPWPGESVTLSARRPDASPGQTVTIDGAKLDHTPGRRQSESTLTLRIRTSQGGQHIVQLPEGARLQQVQIDGTAAPIQARGRSVPLPLHPGSQLIYLAWQMPHTFGFADTVPQIDLGQPAVNVQIQVHAPEDRWVLALQGPDWGPVSLLWSVVLLTLVGAGMMARLSTSLGRDAQGKPWLPLGVVQWTLLGLGMTQLPAIAPAIVAGWFVSMALRARWRPDPWWAHILVQIALLGLSIATMITLYAAVHTGLLMAPDSQIAGNQSSATLLRWFVDRSPSAIPQPTIFSLPMWAWRIAMLGWSLWLAASLLRWLPWAWSAAASGGWPAAPPPSTREGSPPSPQPAPHSTRAPAADAQPEAQPPEMGATDPEPPSVRDAAPPAEDPTAPVTPPLAPDRDAQTSEPAFRPAPKPDLHPTDLPTPARLRAGTASDPEDVIPQQ